MDQRLVAWARGVKARARWRRLDVPPLWLFTDAGRMDDVCGIVERLPRGLCGVVFRHDGAAGRPRLARAVWQICRVRRLVMVVAGKRIPGLPSGGLSPGRHLRGGRPAMGSRTRSTTTASAHGVPELVRARRHGVRVAFLSPLLDTASHGGARSLGVVRWAGMARRAGGPAVLALGGLDGVTARRLPRWTVGLGAIGAFLDG